MAQNSNTRSTNSSSSAAIGGYASTGSGVGITASASRGKGYANSDSVTYANSNINVGGTTTFDIGNDVNLKGGVINTNKAQGTIGGDVNIESLQDTATYDSNQKNIGFTADIALEGAGSSLSVNGGKTDINADYKAVGQQSGIFTGDGGFDLTTEGKTTLIGGAITTTDKALQAGLNNYVSKGGITTQDIENTSSYKGDAIQVGVSLGMTDKKPQGNTNGLGYGTDGDSNSSTTRAGITGIAGNNGITTDNQAEYAGALENVFDATRVNEELGAQTQITQAFDQERRKIKTEINTKEKKLRDKAEEQRQLGNTTARDKLIEQADKVQNQGLLFDAISSAIYGPNSNGATGYVAKAASPFVSNQIGQYYKEQSETQGDSLTSSQQAGHILAHGILGAAVSYATGNDALTGGVSAGTGEASAPVISNFLYGSSDPANLTAEQKDTVSAITSAIGLTIGATTGSANDAANAAETSKVAVENNQMLVPQAYDKLTAKEKQLYNKLEKRKAPELTAFLKNYESCNSSSCRENVEALYQKASKQFGEIVLKMVKEGDLSLAEVQMLSDNLANKFAKAADGEKGAIASLETNHWSPLGVLGYSQNLDQALALARYNYLVNEKGLTGKALDNALSKDEITQLLALDIPVVGGGGVGPKANKTSSQPAKRSNNNTCSFRGDMLVKTISGYRPISEVWIGNMVLSKNEITGKLSYQSVSNQYNNAYRVTVYITIKDSNGNTQTIVSNKIHPFFTQVNTGGQLPQSSEGHNYQGSIDNAQWIDASNLKAGYQLLSEDGQWQVVQSVRQTDEPLSAYNLTVDNDHTYFVTGSDSTYGVWVHNNCWSSLPDGATYNGKTTPDGRKLVTFVDANGKRVTAYKGTDGRWYDPKVYSPTSPPPKNVIPKDSFPNRDGARAAKGEVYYQTDVEAFEAAKKLGYTTKQSGGRNRPAIFINPKTGKVISRDTGSGDGGGSHVGGVWKQADSIDKLGSNKTRNGTFDANMQKIGK